MSLGTKLPKLVYCDSGGQGVTSPLLWTPPQGPLRLGASGEGLQGGRGEAAAEPQGPRAPRRNSRAHAVPWSDTESRESLRAALPPPTTGSKPGGGVGEASLMPSAKSLRP